MIILTLMLKKTTQKSLNYSFVLKENLQCILGYMGFTLKLLIKLLR